MSSAAVASAAVVGGGVGGGANASRRQRRRDRIGTGRQTSVRSLGVLGRATGVTLANARHTDHLGFTDLHESWADDDDDQGGGGGDGVYAQATLRGDSDAENRADARNRRSPVLFADVASPASSMNPSPVKRLSFGGDAIDDAASDQAQESVASPVDVVPVAVESPSASIRDDDDEAKQKTAPAKRRNSSWRRPASSEEEAEEDYADAPDYQEFDVDDMPQQQQRDSCGDGDADEVAAPKLRSSSRRNSGGSRQRRGASRDNDGDQVGVRKTKRARRSPEERAEHQSQESVARPVDVVPVAVESPSATIRDDDDEANQKTAPAKRRNSRWRRPASSEEEAEEDYADAPDYQEFDVDEMRQQQRDSSGGDEVDKVIEPKLRSSRRGNSGGSRQRRGAPRDNNDDGDDVGARSTKRAPKERAELQRQPKRKQKHMPSVSPTSHTKASRGVARSQRMRSKPETRASDSSEASSSDDAADSDSSSSSASSEQQQKQPVAVRRRKAAPRRGKNATKRVTDDEAVAPPKRVARRQRKKQRRQTLMIIEEAKQSNLLQHMEDSSGGLRRSGRSRFKPLKFYECEQLNYVAGPGGLPSVDPQQPVMKLAPTPPRAKRKPARRVAGRRKPAASAAAADDDVFEGDEVGGVALDGFAKVVDAETEKETSVEVVVRPSASMLRPVSMAATDGVKVPRERRPRGALLLDFGKVSSGVLRLPPLGHKVKERAPCVETWYVASCERHCLTVCIHKTEFKLCRGDHFVVPPQNSYSFRNTSTSKSATLVFTLHKADVDDDDDDHPPLTSSEKQR